MACNVPSLTVYPQAQWHWVSAAIVRVNGRTLLSAARARNVRSGLVLDLMLPDAAFYLSGTFDERCHCPR